MLMRGGDARGGWYGVVFTQRREDAKMKEQVTDKEGRSASPAVRRSSLFSVSFC